MNLQSFEAYCHDCCFSINQEIKTTAEKAVYGFIEDARNSEFLFQIIQQAIKPSTLFVIAEYFVKITLSERSFKGFNQTIQTQDICIVAGQCFTNEELSVLQQKCQLYERISHLMCNSLQVNLEVHVQNSICNLVGLMIQQIMMISGQSFEKLMISIFQGFFQNYQNTQLITIGLKLIQNTLQNIQLYNYYDSYVSYRRIMFQFQGNDILQFIQILGLVLNSKNVQLVKPALKCLKEVLMFNFNVSYFELETDFDPNEQNNVNFPEKFAEYFADPILSQLLFQYVKDFIQVDITVAQDALKCLKRMVSARKRVFSEKMKRRLFAKEMYWGAMYLFENITGNVPEDILGDIMEFNNKLCFNFGLRQIRFDYQFSQNWLYSLQNYCILILQKQIKIKDNHIKQMMELMKRLVKFTSDFKLDNQFKTSLSKTIGEVGKAIIHLLLNSQSSFFSGYNPQNFKKMKHALKDFFDQLFPILQIDLQNHLKLIHHSFKALCNSQVHTEKFIIELSLINYIVINPCILERSVQSVEIGTETLALIQNIISDVLQFIKYSQTVPMNELIQMSVMNLAENMLQYTLSEIDEAIGRQRNQKQYFQQFINPLQEYANSTTDLLLQYICFTLNLENKEIILYSLNIMKETIIRLKSHMFIETFQNLGLITKIKSVLLNLKDTALQKPEFFSCRTQSAEIISILLLDNAYDNYIQSIIILNEILQLQPTKESIETYLYEMLGYFRYVDVSRIFRLLIKQHLPKITDISTYILIQNPDQFGLCKLCLKLMVAVTENKNLRYQYHSSSIVQIELVRQFQTILAGYCTHLLNGIKDEKVKEDFSAQICRLIGLVFKTINHILKGKYISQACQLLFADRKYLDLLIVLLDLASQTAKQMIQYSKSCIQMVQVLQTISFSQLQLFELSPPTLGKLLQIVQVIQHNLLDTLSEEYRTTSTVSYHQPQDKITLDQTTEILANTLEFVSEEQQLANLGMVTSFIQPLDDLIEQILTDLLNCYLKGQCSQPTNQKITYQMFSILCTHQQTFIKILNQIMFSSQILTEDQWRLLIKDLDMRIKPQNVDQFRKNLTLFLQSLNIRT